MNQDQIRVGIVGATGYTGSELLRLLAPRDDVTVTRITSRGEAGKPVTELFPALRGFYDGLLFSDPAQTDFSGCDFVFFATPHGVAMEAARGLLEKGVRIIDLAADFRLRDPAVFKRWYKLDHACPDLLAEAVYGQPETTRDQIRTARIVGMAGCYPTSVQIGLAPLMRLERERPGTMDMGHIIVDSKSGISGSGRKSALSLIAAENLDNFHAYALGGHRHQPEIAQQLRFLSGSDEVGLTFVPHLLPTIRGIHSTIYIRLRDPAGVIELQRLYEDFYADEYFVDVMPPGSTPDTRGVRGSNFARVAAHGPRDDGLIIVLVTEDNLVKGAAGQSIQAMNIMAGLPETAGLTQPPLVP